ncbi:RNA polymerase sigma factor [Pedobacter sp. BMA]|uniref:RNA polymerase sigma factor n=1 Tax=Pedobacter sp. BMA TaxID=1663685 RepID=UPI000A8FF333|nr:RNA polymerase sigma-70 factor [Pedobacter sp. BMA]
MSEKDIILDLKAGKESAFRVVFDQNFKKLYAFSFRILKNKEQAEEVVHDALINVWIHRGKLNEQLSILPYLYTITRRLTLNVLRQISTSQKMMDQLWFDMEKVSNQTEEKVLLSDLQRFTESSINILPQQQQIVFKLSRYEGLNYDEIAEKLQISRNTVKNHLVAALKTLRMHFHISDMSCFLLISSLLLKK